MSPPLPIRAAAVGYFGLAMGARAVIVVDPAHAHSARRAAREPRPRLRPLLVALLVVTVAGSAPPGWASQDRATRTLPPHDYWLVPPDPADAAGSALMRLRNASAETLVASGALSRGFPRAGRTVLTPLPAEPGVSRLSCVPADLPVRDSACLVLDQDGSFVNFSYVDYPSARACLFEAFLLPKPPRSALAAGERYSRPRVVVDFPVILRETWRDPEVAGPGLLDLLQQGLLRAGARPLVFKKD